MAIHISFPHDRLVEFCRRWSIVEVSFFGSVLRTDFDADSDVDVMIDFAPGKTPGLDIITIQDELEAILGRTVDVLTKNGVENSRNTILRDEILRTAETYYAA